MRLDCIVLQLLFSLLVAGSAYSQSATDIPGSKDYPLVSRYEGAQIIAYKQTEFDEYNLLIRKALHYGGISKNLASTQSVEGKLTEISYRAPQGRSTLEVFRNYESELQRAGFETLFACRNEECGGRNFNHAVTEFDTLRELYPDQRYLAGRIRRAQGDIYVVVYVALGSVRGGPRNTPYIKLDVIETSTMETGKVTVDMSAMQKGLTAEGHIALYNIYFDTNEASIKPDSRPALEEIAKLLRTNPQLKLLVVGHTDNVGETRYNVDLSERRARAVVQALTEQYSIAPSRVTAAGVGMYAPVASNKMEEGRAKNRRVELVER